jgi:hypothetical protein
MAGLGVGGVANAASAKTTGPSVRHPAVAVAKKPSAMKTELHRLRNCESGDHYRLNTGNGYFGAYQFSAATWHALGYHGRPDRAKVKTQDSAAKKEHKVSGWGAWPSCSSREHLR